MQNPCFPPCHWSILALCSMSFLVLLHEFLQLECNNCNSNNWLIYTSTTSSLCKSIICPWKNLAGVISVVQVFIIPVMAHEHIPCNARECQNRFMDLCVYQLQSLRQRLVKSQPRISLQCSSGLHTEKSVHIHFNSKSTLVLFCKDHTQTQGKNGRHLGGG